MADGPRFDFTKASVLMIDASPLCIEVLTVVLSGFGFRRMHRVSNFDAATEVVKVHAVDLIFMDPYPYKNAGYDFARWLRSERLGSNSETPILITSANAGVRVISAARECGADYVIAKPFSTRTVIDRIVWVATAGRRGELMAPTGLVSATGSGVDLW